MRTALMAALLVLTTSAQAADALPLLDDPTRPPTGVAGADGSVAVAGSVGLTSVMLPRKGRAAAVIDGQLVELGGRVRDARLVKVSEASVVLDGEGGRETLYLTPDVEKTTKVSTSASRRKKEGP